MDLENILRQKAAAKEAERTEQQKQQEAALAEAERLQKQEAEESRLVGLRQSITDIDTKTEQMQSVLAELKQAHEQAKTSVGGAKKEGQELTKATAEVNKLFTNEQFRALLAEEGIESLDDLLQAEEYSEQEQVKSVKGLKQSRTEKRQTAREQIGSRRQAKVEAHKAITTERPDVPQKLTYKDVVAVLEELVQDLGNERKKLYYQTPEGQEALKAEILDRVSQRHEKIRSHYRLASKQEINNRQTITKGDIEDGGEYGEEKVKDAIKDYYEQVIDGELTEEAKRNGQPQLQEAVGTIEGLPKRWREIRATLRELRSARRETIDRLAGLLGNDRNAPLFQQVNNYGHWGYDNPQKLAETFVDANAGHNAITLGLGMGTETPEVILERIISDQENLLEQARSGNLKKAFSRTDVDAKSFQPESYRYETKLDNPERVAIILAEQREFYRKFQAALTTPEEVLAKMKGRDNDLHREIHVRSQYDLGLDDRGQIKSQLDFDGKTYATLRDTPLSQIKVRLEQQQKELEKITATLKEQIGDKVEADWDSTELSAFQYDRENYQSIQEAERIVKMQKIAETLSPRLDLAISGLQEQMDQQLSFGQRGQLSFDSIPEKDLQRLQKEIAELQQEIQKVEANIRSIDQRAVSEGDGLLGRKRKQREQEKATLDTQKQTLQERLQNLQAEYQPKAEMDKKLDGVRSWLYTANREGLELKMPRGSISSRELVDSVKGQMNFQLTPERSQVYKQYQALKKKQEQTAKQYDKWRR